MADKKQQDMTPDTGGDAKPGVPRDDSPEARMKRAGEAIQAVLTRERVTLDYEIVWTTHGDAAQVKALPRLTPQA